MYTLERYGPNKQHKEVDFHAIRREVAELVLQYHGWFKYREGAFSRKLDSEYFEAMDLNDAGHRLIFLTEFPEELARNIIKFEAIRQGRTARDVYQEYRRQASWYWCAHELDPETRENYRHAALIIGCLLKPKHYYARGK